MNEIMFFTSQYLGYFWLIIAVILLFAEVATPGLFFFIAFAIGSCIAAILAFLEYHLVIQCLVGLVTSLVAFSLLRHYFAIKGRHKFIRTNIEAMVGKSGIVIKEIGPYRVGLVKIEGEVWSAQVEGEQVLEKGKVVQVVDVKGNRLIVKG